MSASLGLYGLGWLPLLTLGLSASAQAQTPSRTLLVKATPQYVVVGGYWLELEQLWRKHPRHSFSLTPQLYAGPTGRPDAARSTVTLLESDEKVRGGGLQAMHRWYLGESKASYPAGLYASYGPHFQHFSVSRQGQEWVKIIDPTGLPRYEYRQGRHTETISRYGASAQLGYQAPLAPGRFFLDLYVGLGWRESQSRAEGARVRSHYQAGSSDYGHGGLYFPAGVKLGFALR
ncbi:hypothetical protein [Hymenobacter tenuis]